VPATLAPPPSPPDLLPPDPEALIEEARARQRRRRLRLFAALALAAAVVAVVFAVRAHGGGRAAARAHAPRALAANDRCPPGDLGLVAFVRGGALDVLDLHGCTTRTLVDAHVQGPLQFSADGRYVAFAGGFVATRGGGVVRTAGAGTWSPRGDLLAVGTKGGGLVVVRPRGEARRLLPDGWGVTTLAFSPGGRTLAVSRSGYELATMHDPSRWKQQIWLVDVSTGARRLLYRLPEGALAPAWLQGFSPDGRWLLFWEDSFNSASLAADGLPLLALPLAGGTPIRIADELHYRDYVTWCGNSLVYVVDRGGRQVTLGDGIAIASPPSWRSQTILAGGGRTSWTSVACKSGSGLVVAGGPRTENEPFGQEHRSLWMVAPSPRATPQRLSQTVPPKGETDELPMWSGDGRWILFVRTKQTGDAVHGKLYALDPFGGNLVGPIAAVGSTGNYYGAYGWPNQLAYFHPNR
jgi:dipeptidyl aminopeptidase/acylaminoacyl peptidase